MAVPAVHRVDSFRELSAAGLVYTAGVYPHEVIAVGAGDRTSSSNLVGDIRGRENRHCWGVAVLAHSVAFGKDIERCACLESGTNVDDVVVRLFRSVPCMREDSVRFIERTIDPSKLSSGRV